MIRRFIFADQFYFLPYKTHRRWWWHEVWSQCCFRVGGGVRLYFCWRHLHLVQYDVSFSFRVYIWCAFVSLSFFFSLLCILLLSLNKIIDITRKLSRFCFLIFKFYLFFGQKIRKSHLASFFKSVSYTVANMNSNRNEYLFRHWI